MQPNGIAQLSFVHREQTRPSRASQRAARVTAATAAADSVALEMPPPTIAASVAAPAASPPARSGIFASPAAARRTFFVESTPEKAGMAARKSINTKHRRLDATSLRSDRQLREPCETIVRPLLGESLGTFFLDFLSAQFLALATGNFTTAVICTGATRYMLMSVLQSACACEFNPAITLGRMFSLQQNPVMTIVLIAGQFFGAFIGECSYAATRPMLTAQSFPLAMLNTTDAFNDRLPALFQSYFLIELISSFTLVVTFLRTQSHACMATASMIAFTIAFYGGSETRATGNLAQIVARATVGGIWKAQKTWRYVEAAAAAAIIAPFVAAILFWILYSTKDLTMRDEDNNSMNVESNG